MITLHARKEVSKLEITPLMLFERIVKKSKKTKGIHKANEYTVNEFERHCSCYSFYYLYDVSQIDIFSRELGRIIPKLKKDVSIQTGGTYVSLIYNISNIYAPDRRPHLKIITEQFNDTTITVNGNLNINFATFTLNGCNMTLSKMFNRQELLFFSEAEMYVSQKNNSKKFMFNLNTINYMDNKLSKIILKFFSEHNPIWKDIIKQKVRLPISIDIVAKSRNPKQLLENKFNVQLPNSVNKNKIVSGYIACIAFKYVLPEQRDYLFKFSNLVDKRLLSGSDVKNALRFVRHKVIAEKMIIKIFKKRIECGDLTVQEWLLKDYLRLAFMLNHKIDLLAGKKKIKALHDDYAVQHRLKNIVKMKIPETQLSKLELPPDFVRITTTEALVNLAARESNCVSAYINRINNGECLIYHLVHNNESCTIEIGLEDEKYILLQIRKTFNKEVSSDTLKYVKKPITAANSMLS